jgi:DNA repair protein RadA/Sms
VVAFGEIGLSGEVRRVSQMQRRHGEAKKLGFTDVIAPGDIADVAGAIARALG